MKTRIPLKKYNVLFWNCNGKDSNSIFQDCLHDIVQDYKTDIVALCECKDNPTNILSILRTNSPSFSFIGESLPLKDIGCIRVFSKISQGAFTTERKSNRFLSYAFFNKYDLCFVHLKSVLSISEESKAIEDLVVIEDIHKKDVAHGNKLKKFIIGDFNANPFSNSMINTRLFNSVRYSETNKSCHRKQHYDYNIYINPCWELLGKKNEIIHGTIHNTVSDYYNLGTYLFDQVIFNRDLSKNFDENSLKIITSSSNHNLVSSRGIIINSYSDHLPIFFSIKG